MLVATALRQEYKAKVVKFLEMWMGNSLRGSFELWKAAVALGKSERAVAAEAARLEVAAAVE